MQNFHDLISYVMANGQDQFNTRTKKKCRAVSGYQVQYDLAQGFPAITSKKFPFKSMCAELMGFFRGYTSAAQFRTLGTKIWDDNANLTEQWLANPYRQGHDDLGRIYGAQWTDWSDKRIAESEPERDRLLAKGYAQVMSGQGKYLLERKINQLEDALTKLLTDPSDRRIIISGWNVGELDMMALPACHMDYRFIAFDGATPDAPKKLHVVMTIRSWDLFLGGPFNIAETALFLAIMARLAGMEQGTVTVQASNAHIYHDHFAQVEELLTRSHFAAPRLVLSERIAKVDLDSVRGAFERIEVSDMALEGYESHSAIPAPMAA